ncbi:myeloid-associated differentiation marker homolog [Chanos chanos]|uniref:Myeloid-associated differentiation marker homolog n=1 Tax=Chanos chanos TaxID=29144 RepID=A0A6J2WQX3_CHACN|nr:myeloid-associated differentiation marker homolog [Chanos chanos]
MVNLDLRSLTLPVGIVRICEFVLTSICIGLVASVARENSSYWPWCMFTWCFCCFFTLFILIMEFTRLHDKVPISWDDFTSAFAMLASLMLFAVSVIYPTLFNQSKDGRMIGAATISWVCLALYVVEVWLASRKPGEISGFLSTIPGLLKILETFVACIIFTALDPIRYSKLPGLQWCVAVYSLCFIFALLIILLTIAKLTSVFPFSFDKLAIVYNILALMMYMTAVVLWPLYAFQDNARPTPCNHCTWDDLVVVTFMTVINLIVYSLDTAYSIRLVFLSRE